LLTEWGREAKRGDEKNNTKKIDPGSFLRKLS